MAAPPVAPPRRRRLPVLLSSLLLLLAVGAVAVGQFYWVGLHGSLDRLEQSILDARRQQQQMIRRVREAEAELAARAERLGLDPAGAPAGESAPLPIDRPQLAAIAEALTGLADSLGTSPARPAIDWRRLRAELRMLAWEAARLPSQHRAEAAIGGRGLWMLLAEAEQAAALADAAVVEQLLGAAEGLLKRHYSGDWRAEQHARRLAERIGRVLSELAPERVATAAAADRLKDLADRLGDLARD